MLALGGCGGGDGAQNDAPRIQATAAIQLAERADEIAALVEDGEVCTAAHRADELFAAAQEEVATGTVPPELAAELTSQSEALRDEVNCETPPPPAETDEDDEDEGRGKGKGKGRKKDDD